MNTPIDKNKTHSHHQALWRFLNNEKVTIDDLCQPILEHAEKLVPLHTSEIVAVTHDWSRIALKHKNKRDTYQMTHSTDIGYELQSSLIISDINGKPIAPIAQNLVTADKIYSTYGDVKPASHLEELTERMRWIESLNLGKPFLHIIDREADSAAHMRIWNDLGWLFLIRSNANNTLTFEGQNQKTSKIAEQLSFSALKDIDYQGKKETLWVASTPVILSRDARPKSTEGKGIAGKPIDLQLVCTRVVDTDGVVLAEWYLLTNSNLTEEKVADLYYYRWQIESFFKLLKSSGHHMEDWLQETGSAFFKRVLLVSYSCVLVWQLIISELKEDKEFVQILLRLSGRQIRKGKVPATALLEGYLRLLMTYEILNYLEPNQIKKHIQKLKGFV